MLYSIDTSENNDQYIDNDIRKHIAFSVSQMKYQA